MNTYNEVALEKAAALLASKPRSIEWMAKRFKKSERTMKRWIAELRSRGFRIVRDGVEANAPYFLVDAQGMSTHT